MKFSAVFVAIIFSICHTVVATPTPGLTARDSGEVDINFAANYGGGPGPVEGGKREDVDEIFEAMYGPVVVVGPPGCGKPIPCKPHQPCPDVIIDCTTTTLYPTATIGPTSPSTA